MLGFGTSELIEEAEAFRLFEIASIFLTKSNANVSYLNCQLVIIVSAIILRKQFTEGTLFFLVGAEWVHTAFTAHFEELTAEQRVLVYLLFVLNGKLLEIVLEIEELPFHFVERIGLLLLTYG